MCGIIGFTGRKPAKDILIDGLERLEYRGYDSAGIALLNDDDTLTIRKKAGRVSELRELCKDGEFQFCYKLYGSYYFFCKNVLRL